MISIDFCWKLLTVDPLLELLVTTEEACIFQQLAQMT